MEQKFLLKINGNKLLFMYGVDGIIGFTYADVGGFYYKKNIQGDIIAIIDTNGQEIAKYNYDAWGKHTTKVLNNNIFVDLTENVNYTTSGSNNKLLANINPFRYRGYYYDLETGLYYLQSRYYDPETGRFINADVIAILDESKEFINGLNLFAYCGNNPVMLTDESGKAWWHWLVGALVVIGAAMAVVVTAGGILAGIGAVASVLAGGSALTLGATISAGVFVGAFTTFVDFSVVAGIDTIGTIANGGTFGDALNTFSCYGETAMWSTIGGGILGGLFAGISYLYYNQKGVTDAKLQTGRPNSSYSKVDNQGNLLSKAYYNNNGQQYLRYDFNHSHFIKNLGRAYQPHIHAFKWLKYDNIWRYLEDILPF